MCTQIGASKPQCGYAKAEAVGTKHDFGQLARHKLILLSGFLQPETQLTICLQQAFLIFGLNYRVRSLEECEKLIDRSDEQGEVCHNLLICLDFCHCSFPLLGGRGSRSGEHATPSA